MRNKSKKIIGGVSVLALVAVVGLSMQNGNMKGLNGRSLTSIAPAAGEKAHSEISDSDFTHTEEAQVSPAGQPGQYDHMEQYDIQPHEGSEHGHSHSHDGDDGHYDVPIEPTECGVYEHWVAKPVDEEAIKETGKVYRIIGLGDAVTEDFNPERINVYLNQDGLVLDVKCG